VVSILGLAFLAGILSILSPCVLPVLPVILAAAVSQHRYGPAALAAALAISFAVIGLFVATIGFSIGIDGAVLRTAAAFLTIGIGLVLIVPSFQGRLTLAGGPVANWTERRFGGFSPDGLQGQLGVGLLLGAVWSPCVGPTLGAASLLAAQAKNLPQVALTMLSFGLGAAAPLLVLGALSREVLLRIRNRLLLTGKGAKAALGILLIMIGLSVVTGIDKRIECYFVDASPQWLTHLTTRY
jgi:cytochrome c-type biogenesis protein